MKYNDRGEEMLDDTPVELPVKFQRPPSLQDQIKAMVRGELSRVASDQGFESFAESDDFAVEDDVEPLSAHELSPMQEEFHYAKPDKSVLDKRDGKDDDVDTVNKDRKPEVANGGEDGKGRQSVDRGSSAGNGEVLGEKGK